jgi:hypothetical protein
MFRSFEANFLNLKRKSGYTITTKTAAEISSKLAVGLISPISAQIDPIRLGEVQRSIKIAKDYGERLCKDEDLIDHLIAEYPCHSFVIDIDEAKKIFKNVRELDSDEELLETELFNLVRNEGRDDITCWLPIEDSTPDKTDDSINKSDDKDVVKDASTDGIPNDSESADKSELEKDSHKIEQTSQISKN